MKRNRWDDDSEDEKVIKVQKEKKKKKKDKIEDHPANQVSNTSNNEEVIRIEIPTIAPVPIEKRHPQLLPPCRSVDNYEHLNFIDQGTYGMVFRAKCKQTNEVYALKQIKISQNESRVGFPLTAFREINILLALNHPSIVKVKEMVIGSTMDKIYMVMEFCENDIKTVLKLSKQSFSTAEIKRLMIQLLSAVEYMHSKMIIHRDLKSSNLLYSNKGVLSLCDFGLARKYETAPVRPYTFEVVTLWYRAPELLLGERFYSIAIDMWSVGCIFAELIAKDNEPLLMGQGENDQINKIFKTIGAPNEIRWPNYTKLPHANKLSWKLPTRNRLREIFPMTAFSGGIPMSDVGIDLLTKMLNMDPKQRISASESLTHPWLTLETPFATPEDLMPVFKSRHEQQTR